MAYGGEWDLGLGVGGLVAGLRFGKVSRKMGSLGREALSVVGSWDSVTQEGLGLVRALTRGEAAWTPFTKDRVP